MRVSDRGNRENRTRSIRLGVPTPAGDYGVPLPVAPENVPWSRGVGSCVRTALGVPREGVREMLLADEFFYIVHDVGTGKLRLNERAAGLGLAAALLGELILNRNLLVDSGQLAVTDAEPPEDDLGYRVLRQLAADEQNRSLRTLLAYLSQGALERVAVRLTRAGGVEPNKSRRPWGTTVRYLPTDAKVAAWSTDRLYGRVNRGDPLDFPDAMLAGLVAVTGFTKQLWWDGDAVTLRHIAAAVASLPMSMRAVLSYTEAAVGEATLSPHR